VYYLEGDLVKMDYFRQLFYGSVDAIVRIDEDAKIVEVNSPFIQLFRYEEYELIGQYLDNMIVDPVNKDEALRLNERVKTGELFTTEGLRTTSFGHHYNVFITGIPIIENDKYKGAFIIYKDRTYEIHSENEIYRQKVSFESLFRNSNDAIVRIDVDKTVLDINERFESLFGYKLDEIKGQNVDKLISKIEKLDESISLTNKLLEGEKIIVEGIRYGKNAIPRLYIVQGVPIIVDSTVIGGYGIYTDITEKKAAENEVVYMSYHDQLTGLYNRRYFEEQFDKLDKEENMPLGLIMADMNGLKLINDAFGHNAGDGLLKKTGRILKDNCYESHIVSRLGGDEFVILIPSITDEELENVVRIFKNACRNEVYKGIDFSLSFGCGIKTSVQDSNKNLFKRVEDQMYRNKLVESPSIRGKMFDTVIKTLHAKNEREERHSSRVSEYCEAIARALNMNSELVKEMKTAGWLHDIGKIAVSDNILDKPESLEDGEWNQIRKHPEIGYRILNSVNEFTKLAEHILHHHERYDGRGYPKGLKEKEISIQARIIAIADSYDAMTSDRTYRHAMSKETAIQQLRENAGTQFDPKLVEVFIPLIE
jgi:diguanylate cyclase (GGDEF)-like protein/PAS domain S-box-containing protein/putative nucleotidyltransferase with HDIG domain